MKLTRFEIPLPLAYNDGTPIEEALFLRTRFIVSSLTRFMLPVTVEP